MKIITLHLGELDTSCYIVSSDKGSAAVIDPADNAPLILDKLKQNGLTLEAILLTHGHFDHTGAVAALKNKTDAKIYLHSADADMPYDNRKNVSYLLPGYVLQPFDPDVIISDGDKIKLDEITFTVMHTPGHTDGSVMFITDNCIFSGDTIFCGSVGRTDFYSGSIKKQRESLAKISNMSGNYEIYPGHGEATDLKTEKAYNPYLNIAYLERL